MRHFNLALCLLIIASCQNKNKPDSQVELGESKTKAAVQTCFCDELEVDSAGLLTLNGGAYTGNCIINYQNSDKKYIEKQLMAGEINGKVIYYDQNGGVIYEENYVKGDYKVDLKKDNIHCNCKVLTREKVNDRMKYFYEGMLFTGTCSDQYPETNQDYFKASYKDGLLDGYKVFYDRNGEILYQERYQEDSLIQIIHSK